MAQPPPTPTYIFRGHHHPIHHTSFIRHNRLLLTGDAEGYLVAWQLASRRPVAVWRAHEGAILGVREWGGGKLITHGKDNKLVVWRFGTEEAEGKAGLNTVLPVDAESEAVERGKPWVLYVLDVNTLNFCSFGHCIAQDLTGAAMEGVSSSTELEKSEGGEEAMLVAVPNTLKGEAVDIFHIPSCKRLMTVPGPQGTETGMLMAVSILYLSSPSSTTTPSSSSTAKDTQPPRLTLVTAYESGHAAVFQVLPSLGWTMLYLSRPHSQPVLSLAVDPSPEKIYFLTSGADAIIARHPLSSLSPLLPPTNQSSASPPAQPQPSPSSNSPSRLSAGLKSSPTPSSLPKANIAAPELDTTPLKISNTHHAGQQSLTLRSDAKIYATAGWDGRSRVYSAKSMKELAVLKWHKEGVYAVGFAGVRDGGEEGKGKEGDGGGKGEGKEVVKKEGMTVAQKRVREAEGTHWVAVGGKDGKVSLWDIY